MRARSKMNRIAAELAREAADDRSRTARHRWVIGSIGPGTKLPSLGNIAYDPARRRGSLIKVARAPRRRRRRDPDRDLPGHVADQGRRERRQTRPRLRPAWTRRSSCRSRWKPPAPCWSARTSRPPPPSSTRSTCRSLGLNCATGPQEMAEHVRWLAAQLARPADQRAAKRRVARARGRANALPARRRPKWRAGCERFVADRRRQPDRRLLRHRPAPHIAALDADAARPSRRASPRPRRARPPCGCHRSRASIQQVPLRQENSYFSIGERCNANGSQEVARAAGAGHDWDGCVGDGPRTDRPKAPTAWTFAPPSSGATRLAEMNEVDSPGSRPRVNAPLVIDSTETIGDRGGAEAARRQADHQLASISRMANRPPPNRASCSSRQVRRRGDRAHHRRDRHGQDRRGEAGASPERLVDFACSQARAAAIATC